MVAAEGRQELALVIRKRVLLNVRVAAHRLEVAGAEASREDRVVGMAHDILIKGVHGSRAQQSKVRQAMVTLEHFYKWSVEWKRQPGDGEEQ